MFRAFLLPGSLLFSCLLSAQHFDPITVVCTDGPFELVAPVADDDPSTYEWEISYDGQQSWQSADVYTATMTIERPQSGISYRFRYGRVDVCSAGDDCRRTTDPTLLEVDIPNTRQTISTCIRDTLFVGDVPLTRTGDYRTVLQTPDGCDSIVYTSLTVLDAPEEYYFVDLCPDQEFRGQTFSQDTLLTERYQTANGCDSTLHFEITLSFSGGGPSITGGDYLCRGGTLTLGVDAPMAAYAWSDGGTDAETTLTSAGTYRVTVTDFQGCSLELNHDVTLSEVDIIAVDPVGTLCPATATGSIGVVASGSGELRYGLVGSDSLQQEGIFEELAAGHYEVYVENSHGCRATDTATVEETEALYLFAPGKRSAQIERGDSILLPLDPNFAYDTLYWANTEGLTCPDCPRVYAAPLLTQEYTVQTTSPGGCPVEETFQVMVYENEENFAPTAFSPNGDGHNDRWQLRVGNRVEYVEDLRVYDRWGQLHMHRDGKLPYYDDQLSWDGTQFGKKVDTGTYLYVATLHMKQGRTEQISGVITLIR